MVSRAFSVIFFLALLKIPRLFKLKKSSCCWKYVILSWVMWFVLMLFGNYKMNRLRQWINISSGKFIKSLNLIKIYIFFLSVRKRKFKIWIHYNVKSRFWLDSRFNHKLVFKMYIPTLIPRHFCLAELNELYMLPVEIRRK